MLIETAYKTLQKMRADNQPVETWLVNLVEARLYELTGRGKTRSDFQTGQPKD